MLRANGLGCERENQVLFSNLTFDVGPGVLFSVSGKNGSGKSSLLKILAGLCPATSGSVVWEGSPVQPGDPGFLANLLYIGHKLGLQPALSPLQNLKWLLGLSGSAASGGGMETQPDRSPVLDSLQAIDSGTPLDSVESVSSIIQALQTVGLLGVEDLPCEVLSRGQCQRLVLARLWLNPPKCWILDEPFTALDDQGKALLLKRFDTHLSQGGMIVVASHAQLDFNFSRVEKLYLGA